ncbi:coat protein [Parsley yellow leaf curl virus]|nr:coat protein [Parsley yellow leaf curl virus]
MSTPYSGRKRPYTPSSKTPQKRTAARRRLDFGQMTPSRPLKLRYMPKRTNVQTTKMYDMQFPTTTITSDGYVTMLNNYKQGIGDTQRATDTTLTKSIRLSLALGASSGFWAYTNFMSQYHWILIDRDCGTWPSVSDIFDIPSDGQAYPSTFHIKRDMNERFIVKKKWTTTLTSTGNNYGSARQGGSFTIMPNYKKPVEKFLKNLNVKTYWKDTGGGKYEDVKKNAILYVVINDNTNKTTMFANVYGNSRCYFYNT